MWFSTRGEHDPSTLVLLRFLISVGDLILEVLETSQVQEGAMKVMRGLTGLINEYSF